MNKRSLLPWKHLIICFNLLIVWQSHYSDFKFQTEAVEYLPQTEVSSLNNVLYELKVKITNSLVRGYCQNPVANYGFTIRCNQECYDGKKCHISEVTLTGLDLAGTIDSGISDLWQVTVINLSNNKLHGPIPDSLGNLRFLKNLDLSNNQLTGTIPDNLGNLRSLENLFLQYNFLEGGIPSSLGNLSKLQKLLLFYNKLSGSLPTSLGKLQNLQYLTLAENSLSGTLPPELGNLINLRSFYLASNYFSGELPNLEKLTNLQWFLVAGNQLTGQLPLYISKWTNLQMLALQGNNFDGPVHEEYFLMPNLETMMITDLADSTEVKLPKQANLPNIYRLVLRDCSLIGPIPDFISELSTLRHLDLSFNKLTGRIPESMRPNLIYLSLARNNLNGTIPKWIFQATKTRMDLSYNNFSTTDIPIPSDLDLNLFACCCCNVSSTTEPYMLQPTTMAKAYSKKKPQFYNLFINSGGDQTHSGNTRYDADNSTSPFYISPAQNWAYSFSGDFLSVTANSSDYTKRVPCKISNSETSLYDDARLAPVSLNYYGFGLRYGPYNVTLHFAEIVYVDNADYDILKKRIFDIYIQGQPVMKDFDITAHAGGPNKVTIVWKEIELNEINHLLDIQLYWAGKGSFIDFPAFNGPLIAAISVDPLFKVGDEKLAA